MRKIRTLQDVPYREKWFLTGTGFAVSDDPKPDAKPAQVDTRTADAWIAQGWAENATDEKPSGSNGS